MNPEPVPAWITARVDEWLAGEGPEIAVRVLPAVSPQCIHRTSGALILLPCGLSRPERARAEAHETGHALCTVGMASVLRESEEPRIKRLARLWEGTEERIASQAAEYLLIRSPDLWA